MKFAETIGDLRRRQIAGKIYKPLRSFNELCEELGVPAHILRGNLRRSDAPQPKTRHRSTSGGQQSWYDPIEFREWWKRVQEEA